jgi:hypothetical protein
VAPFFYAIRPGQVAHDGVALHEDEAGGLFPERHRAEGQLARRLERVERGHLLRRVILAEEALLVEDVGLRAYEADLLGATARGEVREDGERHAADSTPKRVDSGRRRGS